jgi:BirA family biotin operon repressor/biotin-[acetyl-CoA-carboxylase] ligase
MRGIVWRVEHFEEIDSTNTFVKSQVNDVTPEGLVAMADFQSAGRGRLDRTWIAPPRSSLLCSILLRPSIEPDALQLVVAAVALAARAALVRLSGVRPMLKWPNDLIVGDKKIAGILAEIVATPSDLAVVVGLGVNLTYGGPAGVLATSVLDESGITLEPRALLDHVLEEIEPRHALLANDEGRASLREEYQRALATRGQIVRVDQLDSSISGLALGVDAIGRLVVEVAGVATSFAAGDVVHLRADEIDPW